jgi:hypothetical protein
MQEDMPDRPLYWGIELEPHVDAERIQVHEGRMRRMLQVSGLRSLIMKEVAVGDDFQPAMTYRRRPIASYENTLSITAGEHDVMKDFRWPTLTATLDRGTALQAVADRRERLHDDTLAWGAVLDATTRKSLAGAAKEVMFPTSTFGEKMNALSQSVMCSFYVTNIPNYTPDFKNGLALQAAAAGVYGIFTAGSVIANKKMSGSSHIGDKRWSLWPVDIQPDRYAVARGMIAAQHLIKVRD